MIFQQLSARLEIKHNFENEFFDFYFENEKLFKSLNRWIFMDTIATLGELMFGESGYHHSMRFIPWDDIKVKESIWMTHSLNEFIPEFGYELLGVEGYQRELWLLPNFTKFPHQIKTYRNFLIKYRDKFNQLSAGLGEFWLNYEANYGKIEWHELSYFDVNSLKQRINRFAKN